MAALGAEEFINLYAFVADALRPGIHSINHDDNLNRSFAAGEGLERSDGLRGLVVEQSKVLLLQVGNRRPGLGADDDVQVNFAGSGGRGRRGRRLRC